MIDYSNPENLEKLIKRLRSFGVTTRGIMVGDVHDAADIICRLAAKEAVLGGSARHSPEQHMPETTTKGEQKD